MIPEFIANTGSPTRFKVLAQCLPSKKAASLPCNFIDQVIVSDGAAYRIRTYDPRITKVIVSTKIYDSYHWVGAASGRLNQVHQVGSQSGQGPHIWDYLFKVLWLSPNLKCDLFQPH